MQPSEIITVTGIIGIFGLVWKANKDKEILCAPYIPI